MANDTTGMDYDQCRIFLTQVLTDLLPIGSVLTQNHGEWRLNQSVPSLSAINDRGFKTQNELISKIVDQYMTQVQSGSFPGLNRIAIFSQAQARKAV